jgi:DNA primase
MIGTGSDVQYDILNNSGIRNYILCFDGDEAGDKAIKRFKKNIRKDVFISVKVIPRGKDVNDLTKEEFDKLVTL